MKRIAVIILNWNGTALLRQYMPSVVANTNLDIADVIVADNGSTDDSREVLASEFPEAAVLPLDRNYGFAEGYNRAIAMTKYPVTVLLNSDVRVPKGWLEPLAAYMDAHPDVAAVQPKVLHDGEPDDAPRFEYAGAAGGYLDCHGFPYCRGRLFDTVEADAGQYDGEAKPLLWASGACLVVRSKAYLAAGGLDTQFFAHMEEIDLCWRLRLAGYGVHYVPSSHVYHLGGGSLPQGSPRKTYLNFRNNLLMLYKNIPHSERGRLLFVRRLYDTLALMVELLKGNWGNVAAIWRAHRDFRTMRHAYDDLPSPPVNLLREEATGRLNIIWQYYVRRCTTFDRLPL